MRAIRGAVGKRRSFRALVIRFPWSRPGSFPGSHLSIKSITILLPAVLDMASQKHVVEVPRTLLPRLTWNSSSSRPSITITHHPALASQRPLPQGWSPLNRQIPSFGHTYQSSRFISSSSREIISSSLVSRRPSPSTAPSTTPPSNPIRHNGVYVATFNPARRAFHATPARPRDHHFDTLKFVKRLQAEGFSEEQSVAMMRVLNDIIQESIQNLTRTMVLREGMCFATELRHCTWYL
jgi:hypothetical protein